MKLFVWEGRGVLEDYSSGMIAVIAPDLETALLGIEKTHSHAIGSFPPLPTHTIEIRDSMEPIAFLCWGGG